MNDSRFNHTQLLKAPSGIDILKTKGITSLMMQLTSEENLIGDSDRGVPSLADTCIALGSLEADGERNRGLYVLKSRGMSHSDQVREYQITGTGIRLMDVYRTLEGVLVGSARRHAQAVQKKKASATAAGKLASKARRRSKTQ